VCEIDQRKSAFEHTIYSKTLRRIQRKQYLSKTPVAGLLTNLEPRDTERTYRFGGYFYCLVHTLRESSNKRSAFAIRARVSVILENQWRGALPLLPTFRQ
jgi:hypothetical protein